MSIYGTPRAVELADSRIATLTRNGWFITHDNGAIVCLRRTTRRATPECATVDRMSGRLVFND